MPCPPYAELHAHSNFSFLRGASHPDELVEQAAVLGYAAVAVTDVNSLAGIVRAHEAAKQTGGRLVVGCRLDLETPAPLSVLVYPTDRAAYGRLCRLLTIGKRRVPKGSCELSLHDLIAFSEGLLAVVVPPAILDEDFIDTLTGLKSVFNAAGDDRISLATSCLYGPDDHTRLAQLAALSAHTGVPLVATNDVHYHVPARRPLQDVLTCIRHGCTLDDAGFRLFPHAERYLKPPAEMARLFADYPDAIARTVAIADRARFNLDELRYEYADEVCPPGKTPHEYLTDLTKQGATDRYPAGVPEKVRSEVEHELKLIAELNYAPYFLTVYDLVKYARSIGILCQGRGAAANSAVCYCLGITAVDPARIDMLFERFISKERNEPPDIDIDFEHERREEVIQYIYQKYGRERAALTAEVISYRGRSAIREVGKALGLSLDLVDRMAKTMDWWDNGSMRTERMAELGLNPADPTFENLVWLTREILGFPRHLSQHVGGFVITRGPLCECVPIENAAMDDRTVIEWDKDDIDALGMLKVDVLGLGMMTAISKCLGMVNARHEGTEARRHEGEANPRLAVAAQLHNGSPRLELHTIPPEDLVVYKMICRADTIGVFQIESRAQMSMLPRLKPKTFYDLVIEVAIVRPGPIQGDMVHPYLRRRSGEEPVPPYPNPAVEKVLYRTLGVPLFQEQAMSLAIVAAGFTPGEADQLRRAIAAWKRKEKTIYAFGQKLLDGMIRNGYPREFAERCFEQIKGFSEYGFPESHAASFALLVYASAWLKCHHPAAFCAALINSQPMGFYAPAQLVRDAQEHGVEVRSVDVNWSGWDCRLEMSDEATPPGRRSDEGKESQSANSPRRKPAGPALRLGMRQIKGMKQPDADVIANAVAAHGRFTSIDALRRAAGVPIAALRRLASADAFGSMGLDRQHALWEVRALRDEALPLFDRAEATGATDKGTPLSVTDLPMEEDTDKRVRLSVAPTARLPRVPEPRKVSQDYATVGLSLRAHPVSFLRDTLSAMRVTPNFELGNEQHWPTGKLINVAGVVLVRQRPGTASGVVFMTLEDETGIANLIIRPHIYDRFRRAARHGVLVLARGRVERQGRVVHVLVHTIHDLSHEAPELVQASRDFH